MDSFQQSILKISLHTWRNGADQGKKESTRPLNDFRDDQCVSPASIALHSAMTNDIDPLRTSPSSTAAAGE
jgi:hypothetical protein